MWSEPGSGFEANPYSPAGEAQLRWWFLRRSSRTRYGRPLLRLVAILFLPAIVVQVLQMIAAIL